MPPAAWRAAVLGVVLLACAAPRCECVVRRVSGRVSSVSSDLLSDTSLTDFVEWAGQEQGFFGWNPGGRARIELGLERAAAGDGPGAVAEGDALPVYVLVARSEDVGALGRGGGSGSFDPVGRCGLAGGGSLARFEVYSNLSVEVEAEQVGRYTVVLQDCNGVRPAVRGTVTMVTAEGGHLGVEERQKPAVYTAIALMYAGLAAFWGGSCALHRGEVSPVQVAVAAAFALRAAHAAAEAAFHARRDETGVVTEEMADTLRFFRDASDIWGLFALLLLASGWRTIRLAVTPRERHVAAVLFGTYSALAVLTLSCTAEWFCNVSQVLKLVVIAFVLIAMCVLLNVAVLALRAELPDTRWVAGARSLYIKHNVFMDLRLRFIVYLLLPTAALTLRFALLGWRDEWAFKFASRTASLLLEALMTMPFRPMKGNPLFNL